MASEEDDEGPSESGDGGFGSWGLTGREDVFQQLEASEVAVAGAR